MKEYEVGDRVQRIEDSDEISEGTITELFFEQRKLFSFNAYSKEYENTLAKVKVKWDLGEEEIVARYSVSPLDTELEREFRNTAPEALSLIQENIEAAIVALEKAVSISEKYGVPFSSGVSFISQCYVPESLASLHPDIDKELVNSITDSYSDSEYAGWEHSAVC
jgi:hypothetical protein